MYIIKKQQQHILHSTGPNTQIFILFFLKKKNLIHFSNRLELNPSTKGGNSYAFTNTMQNKAIHTNPQYITTSIFHLHLPATHTSIVKYPK